MVLHSQVQTGEETEEDQQKHNMDNIMEVIYIRAQGMNIREETDKARDLAGRDQLGDFLLGPHRRRTPDGGENWNWKLV